MLKRLISSTGITVQANTHEHLFNVPVKVRQGRPSSVNERILELAVVQRHLAGLPLGSRILELGCSRSWLAITLAAMGYQVIGSDLREYCLHHPNFRFVHGDIQHIDMDPVDCVIAISTIEHVGLGAYKEAANTDALSNVLEKIHQLLASEGWFLLTVPAGTPSEDEFQRVFSPSELVSLLTGHRFTVENADYFKRVDEFTWLPTPADELIDADYRSGVSSVACLKCKKG